MTTLAQQTLVDALRATYEDGRLSRGESQVIRELVDDVKHDRQLLAFMRNQAFAIAGEFIKAEPAEAFAWLERVDKIIDNANRETGTAKTRVHFSPGQACCQIITQLIDAARQTLDVCVFTITDDRISNTIEHARERGVAIRIVSDDDKQFDAGSDIRRLAANGVEVRVDPTRHHMHHKFAIIDGGVLINGSYNWTRGATENHENIVVEHDASIIAAFQQQFDELWKAFQPRNRWD